MKLISDNLKDALIEQIGHEIYNSHLYLFIAGFLKNKGLNNLAKHFEGQFKEEQDHSKMIFDLLTDLNTDIRLPSIESVELNIENIMDIAQKYLDREIETTESLNEIKVLAMEDQNPIVEERIRRMVELQQHEYAEATDFMDKAEITGNLWMNVFIWDLGVE